MKYTRNAKAFLSNAALVTITLVVSLVASEFIARAFYVPATWTMGGPRLTPFAYYDKDPELGWIPRKNVVGTHNLEGSFTSTFRTNSRGLRGGEHDLQKPPGSRRIVVIGDSFTWGWGVDDGQIYTDKLQAMLRNTEVINLGVTAYGTMQEIRYLEREGLRYQPDIVLVGFCLNDIYRPELAGPARNPVVDGGIRAEPASANLPVKSSFLGLKQYVAKKSVLYRLVVDTVNTHKPLVKALVYFGIKDSLEGFESLDVNLMPALRAYPPSLTKSWEQTKSELLDLKRLTADRGIRLVIAVMPSVQSVDKRVFESSIAYTVFEAKDFDLDKPYRLMEEFARANGIGFVNPVAELRAAQSRGERLYLKNDLHFAPTGHDVVGRVLAGYLR